MQKKKKKLTKGLKGVFSEKLNISLNKWINITTYFVNQNNHKTFNQRIWWVFFKTGLEFSPLSSSFQHLLNTNEPGVPKSVLYVKEPVYASLAKCRIMKLCL